MVKSIVTVFSLLFAVIAPVQAANQYTAKQLDALAQRVGIVYWINIVEGRTPEFLSAPTKGATSFRPSNNESFEITELTNQPNQEPFYKVKFNSGKVAYLRPEIFIEEFNGTILTADPLAEKKLKAEQQAEEEKQRVAWINAQGWPANVKEAALKKQPVTGLNIDEVRQVMGQPNRIVKNDGGTGITRLRGPLRVRTERWIYPDGLILTFQNGILNKVERSGNK